MPTTKTAVFPSADVRSRRWPAFVDILQDGGTMPVVEFTDPNPEILAGQLAFHAAVYRDGQLPRRLLELIRLRIAFHNQCRNCMAVRYDDAVADGVTEDLVCSLEKPAEAADLTEADRAALRFADLFATNHLAIDETLIAEMRNHFSERDIFEIAYSSAAFVAGGRLTALSMGVDDLPEYFRADSNEKLAPWGTRETVRMPAESRRADPTTSG